MIARVVNYHSTAELNSCLQLREFPKNSRIFAAFECGANRAPQSFFPRRSVIHNCIGIR